MRVGVDVVLDPELCAGTLQEGIDGNAGGAGLDGIELEDRDAVQFPFLGVMVEIAGENDAAGFGEIHV